MDKVFEYPAIAFKVGDAVTDKKGHVVRIDGIQDNLAPRDCYRCRINNDGDQVVVLHKISGFGEEARSVWWCSACVNNYFDKHRSTLESHVDNDGPF
jgi:hypothetical protein